jgi:molecular chaperone DnaJ
MPKDYYHILGITKTASDDEVKRAYRKLAHQYHPDKAGGDETRFKEINEAYQVLSDKSKRAQYDRFGTADPMGGFGAGAGNPFGGQWGAGGFPGGFNVNWEGAGFDPGQFSNMGDMGDIFESFFEGLGVRPKRKTYERGADLEVQEPVTLEEAFRGTVKKVKLRTFVRCEPCKGSGAESGSGFEKCAVCDGRGEVREERRTFFGSFAQVKKCDRCRGAGEVPKKACAACKGSGRMENDRTVSIDILAGVEDNQLIKIKGMGEAGERGTAPGDLYVRVRVARHRTFERQGADLIVAREVTPLDLLRGKKIEVPTIAGEKLSLEIPAGLDLREPLRVKGEGMPRFGSYGHGDLFVNLIVRAPKKPGAKLKQILDQLGEEL